MTFPARLWVACVAAIAIATLVLQTGVDLAAGDGLFGSLWALWYHLLAGVRHLIWDTGRGLDMESADMLGWAVIAGSIVLTILTAIIV